MTLMCDVKCGWMDIRFTSFTSLAAQSSWYNHFRVWPSFASCQSQKKPRRMDRSREYLIPSQRWLVGECFKSPSNFEVVDSLLTYLGRSATVLFARSVLKTGSTTWAI